MSTQKSARETAEAKFAAKQMRTQEAKRAMNEYEADSRRVDEKTARLKALRLAKEAANEATAVPKKTPTRKKAASRRKAS